MKKLTLLFLLITAFVTLRAQQTADIGIQVGAATYWGDIQNVDYGKSITPVIGVLGRWNFNKRLAIRGQLTTGNLKAEGIFKDAYLAQSGYPPYAPSGQKLNASVSAQIYRLDPSMKYNFSRSFQSVEGIFEFNFRDYKLGSMKKDFFTPFVSMGLGLFISRGPRTGTFILDPGIIPTGPAGYQTISPDQTQSLTIGYIPLVEPGNNPIPSYFFPFNDGGTNDLVTTAAQKTNNMSILTPIIPFGGGIKFNITKRLGGIAEIIFRKTFTDKIDNLDDPKRFQIGANVPTTGSTYAAKQSGFQLNNNDWYSTITFSLCYQIWSAKGNCSVYDKILK